MEFSPVLAKTIERQHRASDPAMTAWVSANAGSGKTHVLTQRVVRLLLRGVAPARILCLTFTKAAAANMSMRVFQMLSRWSTLDDASLRQEIHATGHAAHDIDLSFARRLFARTVETPGGLKIQTIHAFCEKLLHLFPFEANVGAHFRIIEEEEQASLLAEARLRTLSIAVQRDDHELSSALEFLSTQTSTEGFADLVSEALRARNLLLSMDERELKQAIGLLPNETLASLESDLLGSGINVDQWLHLAQVLAQGSTSDRKVGECFAAAFMKEGSDRLETYLSIFFTADGKPRARVVTNAILKIASNVSQILETEQGRLVKLRDKVRAAQAVKRTMALACLLKRVSSSYAQLKDARGALDFDDLIDRTRDLVTNAGAPWVLFKLDGGIDHILVDEAQDTSDPQWQILRSIADEFFAGESRSRQMRTFFAVGDEKQSIYSFQGANPILFDATRRVIQSRIPTSDLSFAHVELQTSFRSAPGILQSVDKVFSIESNRRGLSTDNVPTVHQALKADVPSIIELWPPVAPEESREIEDWRLPLDVQNHEDPPVKVATRIARMVGDWLKASSAERVQDDVTKLPRPIRPGDILILVRRRGPFFEAVIRALKEQYVPVAGADRLELTQHIAIMDLIAAGRVALLPQDDLALACVLKSPLIGLDDDDLLELAPGRTGSLLDALQSSSWSTHQDAFEKLSQWQRDARELTPFGFFSRILGSDGGRNSLLSRLGPEAGDAIDEFLKLALQHDQLEAPSLHSFLTTLEASDISVKRDMEAASDAVRVMTVHASKGLEAKIVLIPDTCGVPTGRHDPKLIPVTDSIVAWSPRAKDDCEAISRARTVVRERAEDEYRRLLYVALTRAQERLYIMGFHGKTSPSPACWYNMIANALSQDMEEVPSYWDSNETIFRLRHGMFRENEVPPEPSLASEQEGIPDWLFAKPRVERTAKRPVIQPSQPSRDLIAPDELGADARRRGVLVHAVIQHLAGIPTERHAEAASALIATHLTFKDNKAEAAQLIAEARAVLTHPELADLFGPGSRSEVALAGRLRSTGEVISGQVDRLSVSNASVTVADFKTGRARDQAPPAGQILQLALYAEVLKDLYPGKTLRTLLIYTHGARIREVTERERLDALAKMMRSAVA